MIPFSTHSIIKQDHDKTWVRTGTDADGNCFFHAYAYSVEANEFRTKTKEERKQRVLSIKHFVAERISMEHVLNSNHPELFEYILVDLEKYLSPLVLPDLSNYPLLTIQSFLGILYKTHPSLESLSTFQHYLHSQLQFHHQRLKDFVRHDGSWIYDSLMPIIMSILQVNIIIISHETQKPITHVTQGLFPHTIYLYHVHDHFESVGLFENDFMKRVFDKNIFPSVVNI